MSPHCLCHALPLFYPHPPIAPPKKQILLKEKRVQGYQLPKYGGGDVLKKRIGVYLIGGMN